MTDVVVLFLGPISILGLVIGLDHFTFWLDQRQRRRAEVEALIQSTREEKLPR